MFEGTVPLSSVVRNNGVWLQVKYEVRRPIIMPSMKPSTSRPAAAASRISKLYPDACTVVPPK